MYNHIPWLHLGRGTKCVCANCVSEIYLFSLHTLFSEESKFESYEELVKERDKLADQLAAETQKVCILPLFV